MINDIYKIADTDITARCLQINKKIENFPSTTAQRHALKVD